MLKVPTLVVVAMLLWQLPAAAQSPSEPPAADSSPWTFKLTPYAWLTFMSGQQTVRGRTVNVDTNFVREFSSSESLVPVMGYFEARWRDKISLFVDVLYANMTAGAGGTRNFFPEPGVAGWVAASTALNYETLTVEFGATYEVVKVGPTTTNGVGQTAFDFLMGGLEMTLIISAITLVLAMAGGLIIALLDMSRFRALRWIGVSIGEVVRNTPILVQLLWVYYVLPIVFGVRIEGLVALIIGLALYQAAFISEVYRSGIQSVPKGHREAAQVLGLTPFQAFRRIVLPQAIRMTLPPLASNFVQLIKFSSLGAVISVSEITRRGMELSATNFRPLETFTFIAVVYFFICWPLAMAIRFWERRLQAR